MVSCTASSSWLGINSSFKGLLPEIADADSEFQSVPDQTGLGKFS
jgi:hypothetical protein